MAVNTLVQRMGDELIARKKKKQREGMISAVGMCLGLLPLSRLFFIQGANMTQLLDIASNVFTITGIFILAFSYTYYRVYYHKARDKYDTLKDELHTVLINNCCCDCGWLGSYKCDCKVKFMQMMKDEHGIKLFAK